jgi:hypothetical protein
MNNIDWVFDYLSNILPEGINFDIRDPFLEDECRWFRAAIKYKIIEVMGCESGCSILKKRKRRVSHNLLPKDQFIVTKGIKRRPRHLFEVSSDPRNPISFGREYLPHIAAYARLIVELGYDQNLSSFSLYQTFSKNLLTKKKGSWYETDAEFYDRDGGLYLHLEVKRNSTKTEDLVNGLNMKGSLDNLVNKHKKELEYVLDLKPKYLWIVGPGSIEPNKYVYKVEVDGLEANFSRMETLPLAP